MENKQPQNNSAPTNVIFYCKDCSEVVNAEKCGKKYVYRCPKCGTKNVAFGSIRSINNFFKLSGKTKKQIPMEDSKVRLGN